MRKLLTLQSRPTHASFSDAVASLHNIVAAEASLHAICRAKQGSKLQQRGEAFVSKAGACLRNKQRPRSNSSRFELAFLL